MYEDLVNWLNGSRDYASGVRILQVYTSYKASIDSLNRFRDERKLLNLLTSLLQESKPVQNDIETKSVEHTEIIQLPASPLDADLAIHKLTEARDLWKQAGNAHSQLKTSKAQNKRKKIAFFILDTTSRARELFKQVDFYNNHGHFYELPKIDKSVADHIPAEDMKALIKRRASIRSGISTYKKKIRDGQKALQNMTRIQMIRKNKELADLQIKIDMWLIEINELNTKIDG